MKALLNFFFGEKNQYIGLSSFKTQPVKKREVKKQDAALEKTALTGLIKRIG